MADGAEEHELVKRAYQAWDAKDWLRAGQLLEQAVRADPDGPDSRELWFDAALAFKFLRNWSKAYELGIEAAARAERDVQDPAFWNLGIAATIQRDWQTARDAWRGYGITLTSTEGEIVENFGDTCVRITTSQGEEVVWARRICPTRARVLSVPFDPSRRFGEIVLHDGAPNGERHVDGRRYPVFDELMLFAPSDLPTHAATIAAATPDDTEALLDLFAEQGLGAEVLTGRELLCKCCSEGSVTQQRDVRAGTQPVLLGAHEHQARSLLDRWAAARPASRSWSNLHLPR